MTRNVVKLPTAATSYYTVRKVRGGWAVALVTPCPGKALRTDLYYHTNRDAAVEEAQRVAARMLRPCKARGQP